jgi:cold shock CspA family protein
MNTGRVVRFDEGRGYGFIAPDGGGDDVFVHANELTDRGVRMAAGTRVQFNVVDGGRGLKAYDVQIFGASEGGGERGAAESPAASQTGGPDEDICEIYPEREFRHLVTDVLIEADPQLTGKQILALRQSLTVFARKNGWVE